MTISFTPGPWVATKENEVHKIFAGGGALCITEACQQDGQEKANAQLIAAAPEMLEALKKINSGLENTGYDIETCWNFLKEISNLIIPIIAKTESGAA